MHANTLLQNLFFFRNSCGISFTTLWIYTTPKRALQASLPLLGFTTLWIYTTPKPQKRTEAATSACITGHSIASYHIASLLSKIYWLPYLCKFVQLPCNFAPLQPLKETSEVATGAKCTQIHYSKTCFNLLQQMFPVLLPDEFTLLQNWLWLLYQ